MFLLNLCGYIYIFFFFFQKEICERKKIISDYFEKLFINSSLPKKERIAVSINRHSKNSLTVVHILITNCTQSLFSLYQHTACHASIYYIRNKNFVRNKVIKLYIQRIFFSLCWKAMYGWICCTHLTVFIKLSNSSRKS